jgi:hypothetical protein
MRICDLVEIFSHKNKDKIYFSKDHSVVIKSFHLSPNLASNMEDKGPMILAVCWTFTALALLFVIARLFVRVAVHRALFIDDYFIILSIVGSTPSLSIVSPV